MSNTQTTEQNIKLLSAKQLGNVLSLSARTIWRLRSSGKLPEPVKVGQGAIRWRQSDIEKWITMGCPDRKKFLARREVEKC